MNPSSSKDSQNSSDETLAAVWEQLLGDWHSDQKHAAFLEACRVKGQLAEAARHYRQEMRSEPSRARKAEQQLQAIAAQAMASLEATRTPPGETKRWITWMAFGVSLLLVVGSILLMTR